MVRAWEYATHEQWPSFCSSYGPLLVGKRLTRLWTMGSLLVFLPTTLLGSCPDNLYDIVHLAPKAGLLLSSEGRNQWSRFAFFKYTNELGNLFEGFVNQFVILSFDGWSRNIREICMKFEELSVFFDGEGWKGQYSTHVGVVMICWHFTDEEMIGRSQYINMITQIDQYLSLFTSRRVFSSSISGSAQNLCIWPRSWYRILENSIFLRTKWVANDTTAINSYCIQKYEKVNNENFEYFNGPNIRTRVYWKFIIMQKYGKKNIEKDFNNSIVTPDVWLVALFC